MANQEEECRPLAERAGYPPDRVRVYGDNDLSAYSGRPRPAYRRLIRDIEGGEVTLVVAWHNDRLHRSNRETADFVDLVVRTGVRVEYARSGHWDLATATGRLMATQMGAIARYESEHKAERHRLAEDDMAREGRPHMGPRPFGYEADHVTVREDEAELIRDAVRRVLDGESVHRIVLDWQERRVRTPQGHRWEHSSLRKMLCSGRIAGQREHRGKIVGEGKWPGIISVEQAEQVRRRLKLRKRERPPRQPRRYLLSGLAYCGRCGSILVARPTGTGKRAMVCTKERGQAADGGPACGALRIITDPLEELVSEYVIQAVEGGALGRLLGESTADATNQLQHQLTAVEARMEHLAEGWAAGELTDAEWKAARASLADQHSELTSAIASEMERTRKLDVPDALREAWPSLTFAQRRTVVETLIDRVTIAPARRGLARFDPDRVTIGWRA